MVLSMCNGASSPDINMDIHVHIDLNKKESNYRLLVNLLLKLYIFAKLKIIWKPDLNTASTGVRNILVLSRSNSILIPK